MSPNAGLAQDYRVSVFKTFMVAERVSQGHAPAPLSTQFAVSPTLRATMAAEDIIRATLATGEPFMRCFPANVEALRDQQNFTAMIATGFALGRMLMPVGRQGLRMAWHALDRATGMWRKIDDEEEVDLPEEIANAMGLTQQPLVTPNKKVKDGPPGAMAIHSDPLPFPPLLAAFRSQPS